MEQTAFNMIGNIYYVGTEKVSSHLFTSDAGHVLMDACYPGDGPVILQNIRELGFDPKDVKYLLISHAHADHLGGAAYLVEHTGAKVCIGEKDVKAAEQGSQTQLGLIGFSTFKVDQALREGDCIELGPISIKTFESPGHTPGCCSFGFTVGDQGKRYRGMMFGGPGVNVFQEKFLAQNIYGGELSDFINSVKRLLEIDAEVWLGAHPGQSQTFQKRELLTQGQKINPYIDPQGWKTFLAQCLHNAEKLSD